MTYPRTLQRLCLFVIAWLAAMAHSPAANARPARHWSEAELWDQADVVVIAKAHSTKDVNRVPADPPPPETWVAVATTFEIQAVLKGKPSDKSLEVRHHRYLGKDAEVAVVDGPSFVEFTAGKHQYLMFLKAEKVDGAVVYEPLTGQFDPDRSFRRVEPYHVSDEREKPKPAAAIKPGKAAPEVKND
jgi:hypothetical protein